MEGLVSFGASVPLELGGSSGHTCACTCVGSHGRVARLHGVRPAQELLLVHMVTVVDMEVAGGSWRPD